MSGNEPKDRIYNVYMKWDVLFSHAERKNSLIEATIGTDIHYFVFAQ